MQFVALTLVIVFAGAVYLRTRLRRRSVPGWRASSFCLGLLAIWIAMGSAIASLADEPSSGLDRITSSEIDDLLLQQKAERNTTLIIVTHDVRSARRVGDRVAVLDTGRLVACGPVAEVEQSDNEVARELVRE